MVNEIERKFRLERLPKDISPKKIISIKQAYVFLSNSDELRIRKANDRYLQTVKSGFGISREEIEIELTPMQFEKLWLFTENKRIFKKRYRYEIDGNIIYVDEYEGVLKGLFTAEVEFDSLEEALLFKKPPFFLEEITYDNRYKNKNLSTINSADSIKGLKKIKKSELIIGTLPFYKKNDETKVVMVTTRNGKHWIFPKGHPEKGMTYEEVAIMEAKEEAGINGRITASPILLPCKLDNKVFNMLAFPIEIKKLSKNWEEKGNRKRKKIPLKEAHKQSDRISVNCGLEYLKVLTKNIKFL